MHLQREKPLNRFCLWFRRKENIWILLGILLAISAIYLPFLIMHLYNLDFQLDHFDKLGPLGDFFGGITAGILSLVSIMLVTAAIIMQKEELALQREELEKTREEIALQREELEKTREEYNMTNKTMKKQQFENTLFNLINNHHEIIKSMEFANLSKNYGGRRAIRFIHVLIAEYLKNHVYSKNENKDEARKKTEQKLKEIFSEFGYQLDHYLYNIFTIINFIDDDSLLKEDRKFYLDMFFSLLSSDEKYVLFCFINFQNEEKILELLQKYDPTLEWFLEYEEINRFYNIFR